MATSRCLLVVVAIGQESGSGSVFLLLRDRLCFDTTKIESLSQLLLHPNCPETREIRAHLEMCGCKRTDYEVLFSRMFLLQRHLRAFHCSMLCRPSLYSPINRSSETFLLCRRIKRPSKLRPWNRSCLARWHYLVQFSRTKYSIENTR